MIVLDRFGGSGITDLLIYGQSRPKASQAMFVTVGDAGRMTPFQTYDDWDPGWDIIVPGLFGGAGQTDLLFWKKGVILG